MRTDMTLHRPPTKDRPAKVIGQPKKRPEIEKSDMVDYDPFPKVKRIEGLPISSKAMREKAKREAVDVYGDCYNCGRNEKIDNYWGHYLCFHCKLDYETTRIMWPAILLIICVGYVAFNLVL
jgi:hypothetical protein